MLLLFVGSIVRTLWCSVVCVDSEVFGAFGATPGVDNPGGFTIDLILDDVCVACLV